MYKIDGLKILNNDQERRALCQQLIDSKNKECESYNGEKIMSMEEIIEEIYAYRREKRGI